MAEYDFFGDTQQMFSNFSDLYNRNKDRTLKERELSLKEKSQGVAAQYKKMLIDKEMSELKMKQDLADDPATRSVILSKTIKNAYRKGGSKYAESVLKTFQASPKYAGDTKGYTIDDFQFNDDSTFVIPARNRETGELIPDLYGYVDDKDILRPIKAPRKKETTDKSESEFRQWSSQLNSLYNKRSSIRMGINPLTGIALPRDEIDAALADNAKVIKRIENRMKTQYPDQWETFGEEETQEQAPTPAPVQSTIKKLDKETAKQFLEQTGGDKEKARELARQAGYEF